jgi:hypothetical protein
VAKSSNRSPGSHRALYDLGMKVAVDMKSIDLSLGNNGIVLYVYDNANKYVGKLRVGQATVEWCKGKVPIGKGQKISLENFIANHLNAL